MSANWRVVQRGSGPLVVCYLVGSHLDQDLRDALPGLPIVATGEAPLQGDLAGALRAAKALPGADLVLVGYSAGCQPVRKHLVDGVRPAAVVTIDGTHASMPPQTWQLEVWQDLAERARAGECMWVASCTQQTYVERIAVGQPGRAMATVHVLEKAVGQALPPGTGVNGGALRVFSYPSKDIDKQAHIDQQREVLPQLLREHVAPWIDEKFDNDVPDTDPLPPAWKNPALPHAERMVLWCVAELEAGVREEPPGSNTGPRIREYLAECARRASGKNLGLTAAPWCAAAQAFCQRECLLPGEHEADHGYYCSGAELRESAQANGVWRANGSGYAPKRGDLVVLMRAGAGSDPAKAGWERHVVRVEHVLPSNMVQSIGGNEGNGWGRQTFAADADRVEGYVAV
jgi:hypothetical protein